MIIGIAAGILLAVFMLRLIHYLPQILLVLFVLYLIGSIGSCVDNSRHAHADSGSILRPFDTDTK